MSRTKASSVQGLLEDNYNGTSALKVYIDMASALVDRVAACATAKARTLTAAELELIERNMAAHYYTRTDPLYASKSEDGASASFVQSTPDPERYKQNAIEIDYSGCLKSLLSRQSAVGFWLGKVPSEQIPYVDRD